MKTSQVAARSRRRVKLGSGQVRGRRAMRATVAGPSTVASAPAQCWRTQSARAARHSRTRLPRPPSLASLSYLAIIHITMCLDLQLLAYVAAIVTFHVKLTVVIYLFF